MAIDQETQDFFTSEASAAGIPTTEDELKTEFQTQADSAGLTFNNNSAYSPFWRFLQSIAVTPFLQLLQWIMSRMQRSKGIVIYNPDRRQAQRQRRRG